MNIHIKPPSCSISGKEACVVEEKEHQISHSQLITHTIITQLQSTDRTQAAWAIALPPIVDCN